MENNNPLRTGCLAKQDKLSQKSSNGRDIHVLNAVSASEIVVCIIALNIAEVDSNSSSATPHATTSGNATLVAIVETYDTCIVSYYY